MSSWKTSSPSIQMKYYSKPLKVQQVSQKADHDGTTLGFIRNLPQRGYVSSTCWPSPFKFSAPWCSRLCPCLSVQLLSLLIPSSNWSALLNFWQIFFICHIAVKYLTLEQLKLSRSKLTLDRARRCLVNYLGNHMSKAFYMFIVFFGDCLNCVHISSCICKSIFVLLTSWKQYFAFRKAWQISLARVFLYSWQKHFRKHNLKTKFLPDHQNPLNEVCLVFEVSSLSPYVKNTRLDL